MLLNAAALTCPFSALPSVPDAGNPSFRRTWFGDVMLSGRLTEYCPRVSTISMNEYDPRGFFNDRILYEVSREQRNPGTPAGNDEERPSGHAGKVRRVWEHDVQDRQGVLIDII